MLQSSDRQDLGTQAQRTPLLHLLCRRSPPPAAPHLPPSPGRCLGDSFQLPGLNVLLRPGLIAWLPHPHPHPIPSSPTTQ